MTLFIAFLIGGLSAFLFPGTTRSAAENAKTIRGWVSRSLPSFWFRMVIFGLGAFLAFALLTYLHAAQLAEPVVAFLLAVLLGHLITDYVLTPRDNDTARIVLLAGTSALLIVLAIFPPDFLRRALARLNVGGVSIELIRAAPVPKLDLPSTTLVKDTGSFRFAASNGLGALERVVNRLEQLAAVSDFFHAGGPRSPSPLGGYPSPGVRKVFVRVLLPLASCAEELRSGTVSQDDELIFDARLVREIRLSFNDALRGKAIRSRMIDWLQDGSVTESWRVLVEWHQSLRSGSQPSDGPFCSDASLLHQAAAEFSDSDISEFQDNALRTLHYPFFVASILQARGDHAEAAEIISRWVDRERDQAGPDLTTHIERFYATVAKLFFLGAGGGQFFDANTARHEEIASHRAALASLDEVFRLLHARDIRMTLPDGLFQPSLVPRFTFDRECAADRSLAAVLAVADSAQIRTGIEYMLTSYRENINNLAYRATTLSPDGNGDSEMTLLRRHNAELLEGLDLDCLPPERRHTDFLHYVDTIIALNLLEVQQLAWDRPIEAQIRLCQLVGLEGPVRTSLSAYKASLTEAGEDDEPEVFSVRLLQSAIKRAEAQLVEQIELDLVAMRRFFAAFANDKDMPLDEAQKRVCG